MYEEKEIKFKKIKNRKKKNFNLPKNHKINLPKIKMDINWKQLFTRLFILLLVMILIIFIISRINKNNQQKDLIINNNIEKIINASLKYYKKDNLPKNIGDSSSLLLNEMVEKKLITDIKDKNNNKCNASNSYIIINKIKETDYRLKIYLSCPKEEKTIEKDLICDYSCQIK